jgi:hypothetical protein
MQVINLLIWPFVFIWDKVIFLLSIGQRSNELESFERRKEYSELFLNDFEHQEKIKVIWSTLFKEQFPIPETSINKIYRLNNTIFIDFSLKRITYYISNHFWSLLDFFEIDTWSWSDKDVFEQPSLITYAIIKKDKTVNIVVASLINQQYTLLRSYTIKKIPLWKFKKRQLAYDADKGFLSI